MVRRNDTSAIVSIERREACDGIVCQICGPRQSELIGSSNNLPVVRCDGCGLMYVAECSSLNDTQEFFRDEYIKDSKSAQVVYVDYRKKSLQREAVRIRDLMPKGGRLLDVGTASGCFLRQFQGFEEWQVEGVEPSKVSVEFARREFGLKVHEGFLSDQEFPESSYDVVCSLDAFICHRRPREDMQEFFRVLAPGGLLAIEIPGHRFRMLTGSGLLYRTITGRSLRLNAGVNFYYYTRATLNQLASNAGFEFMESHPEGMPTSGNRFTQIAREAYDYASGVLYRATSGNWNFSAKELCIFRKPHTQFNSVSSQHSAEPRLEARRAG